MLPVEPTVVHIEPYIPYFKLKVSLNQYSPVLFINDVKRHANEHLFSFFSNELLKVPRQYTLLGYKPHGTHLSVSGHIHRNVTRPLRTGAEVRMIQMKLFLLLFLVMLLLLLFCYYCCGCCFSSVGFLLLLFELGICPES